MESGVSVIIDFRFFSLDFWWVVRIFIGIGNMGRGVGLGEMVDFVLDVLSLGVL